MFVQNQINDLPNHKKVITDVLHKSCEARFVVAYVKENGVDMIVNALDGKPIKLLCSFDMGITQISGIKKLLEKNVEVRVYRSNEGTFHPKMWLFKETDKWQVLVGSANFTRAALVSNVEVGVLLDDEHITANAVMFFNYLWNSENSHVVTMDEVNQLQQQFNQRRKIASSSMPISTTSFDESDKVLFDFVKSWIDIAKSKQKGISSIWRGWYIIPDHGYVDNQLIKNLKSYLPFIHEELSLDRSCPDENYQRLLQIFMQNNYPDKNTMLSHHDLFVRQAKNYLIKFGWAYHPLRKNKQGELKPAKNILVISGLGEQINQCESIQQIKQLYSEYFAEYSFNGLRMVKFTRQLLDRFDVLNLQEFDYFVTHAYNEDDLAMMVKLITLYRKLADSSAFDKEVKQYFNQTKELTGGSVRGNYVKNVKHTMSAIAWCDGLSLSEDFVLRRNEN